MIDGLKVSNKWAPISGSPIVNVSRVLWGYSRLPNAKQNTHCQSCTLTTSIPLVWAPKVSISRGVQLHGSQLTQTILASLRYCNRLDTLVFCTTENKRTI